MSEVAERERLDRVSSGHIKGKQVCAICGWPKWGAIHQPPLGKPPGSPAWGHEYDPISKDPNQ